MSVQIPAGLPARAYLISYDVERGKLTGSNRAELVQAAALAQLFLAGLLTDEKGKAKAGTKRIDDAVLDALLERIADSRLRSWKHWVTSNAKATDRAVRDRLAAERVISIEDGALLGFIPRQRVTVRDTRIVRQLIAETRSAMLTGSPENRRDVKPAALVALVAAVELNTVFTGRERREHREKIKLLAEQAGPAARGLRQVIEEQSQAGAIAIGIS